MPETNTEARAKERGRTRRGGDNVTGDEGMEDALPAVSMMRAIERELGAGQGESYASAYARTHKGARSGAAEAADKERLRTIRMAAQREFSRRTGMTEHEYNQLQKYKAAAAERKKQFVAQARAGKFQGNIWLNGQNWKDLASAVDDNGNLAETVDLSATGKNKDALAALAKWGASINDPKAARYGGRYNMNALPKGIFTQNADGTWKINEAMITSQAQVNALVQMMNQDNARQGAGKAEQDRRQKGIDDKNREFLKTQGVEGVDKMSSEQLASSAGAARQEIADKTLAEFNSPDNTGEYAVTADAVTDAFRAAGRSATDINKALGRPDTQKEYDEMWKDAVDFDNLPATVEDSQRMEWQDSPSTEIKPEGEVPPAEPRDQSPKTDQSPKVAEEEKK